MGHKFIKWKGRRQTCLWLRSPFSFVFSFAAPKFNDLFLVWFLVLLCLVQHFLQHTRRGHKQTKREINKQCCNKIGKAALIQAWQKDFSIGGCWCYVQHMILLWWQFSQIKLSNSTSFFENEKDNDNNNPGSALPTMLTCLGAWHVCQCASVMRFFQQSKGAVCVICILSVLWV